MTERGGNRKQYLSFPTANPGIAIKSVSDDPKSSDFTSFCIVKTENQRGISTLRADDIVQMRRFMACLGHSGTELFSDQADASEIPIEATQCVWDIIHPSDDELVLRHTMFSQTVEIQEKATDPSSGYAEALQNLPLDFYSPSDLKSNLTVNQVSYPGQVLPMYNPATTLPTAYRRPWHDVFRPPHGPPVFCPISMGYGPEVGLPHGQQALWEPINRYFFFLDHINKIKFFEDFRKPPMPKPIVAKREIFYGDMKKESALPRVCRNAQVIVATAQRALSKPHGLILFSNGVDGPRGTDGQYGANGAKGKRGENGEWNGRNGHNGENGLQGGSGVYGQNGTNGTNASDVVLTLGGTADELHVTGTCHIVANLGGERCEEVFYVNCRGGDGGDGGHGGRGGDGGAGGDGGLGISGKPGDDSSNGPASHGGDGGNGGNGGEGGNGGYGGRGGDGGHAGCGGVCLLQAHDPRLFMLMGSTVQLVYLAGTGKEVLVEMEALGGLKVMGEMEDVVELHRMAVVRHFLMVVMEPVGLLELMEDMHHWAPMDQQVSMAILLLMEVYCGLLLQKMEVLSTSLALDTMSSSLILKPLLD